MKKKKHKLLINSKLVEMKNIQKRILKNTQEYKTLKQKISDDEFNVNRLSYEISKYKTIFTMSKIHQFAQKLEQHVFLHRENKTIHRFSVETIYGTTLYVGKEPEIIVITEHIIDKSGIKTKEHAFKFTDDNIFNKYRFFRTEYHNGQWVAIKNPFKWMENNYNLHE